MSDPSRFTQIQADAFLGAIFHHSPFGKVWYVDGTNGADGNAGDSPSQAFASVGQAITASAASRGDTVVIYPGTYSITSALSPKAHVTFRAALVNAQTPSVTIQGNLATLVNVDVNGTRWVGIEFKATGGTNRDLVRLADTTAVTGGVVFEDCVFNGDDKSSTGGGGVVGSNGVAGIWTDNVNAVTGLVVRRSLFRDLGKTQLEIGVGGAPYAVIEDNRFIIDTNLGWGISLEDTAAFGTGKGYVIRNNEFIGPDATTTSQIGIRLVGTLNTTGAGMIRTNYFAFCLPAAITQQILSSSIIENYVGDGLGGSKVDPMA